MYSIVDLVVDFWCISVKLSVSSVGNGFLNRELPNSSAWTPPPTPPKKKVEKNGVKAQKCNRDSMK